MKKPNNTLILILFATIFSFNSYAQTFTEQTGINITGVEASSVAWGDYDNDGDLDFLLTGYTSIGYISKIYKNNGNNSFSAQMGINLSGVMGGSVAWGDYDNDGDLDILLTGSSGSFKISKIYKNNGNNSFSEQTGISLTGVFSGSVAWGDYDNDGDLDILLTGSTSGTIASPITKIYKNNGNNSFSEQTSISLIGVWYSSVAWGDYDNDGDLDILLTGSPGPGLGVVSKIYRNNGNNSFTEQTSISLTAVYQSSVAWGDYDNDGDLDILLTGESTSGRVSKIYKNIGNNSFTEQTGISLTGVHLSSAAWGDYDNDGDLDILLSGNSSSGVVSKIYKNNSNNSFTEQTAISLAGVFHNSVVWGDYDNDGDLDILLTGYSISLGDISKIYKNNSVTSNPAPTAPTGLNAQIIGNFVRLSWNHSTDSNTSSNALNYNIRVGSTTNGIDLNSPESDLNTGFRRIVEKGSIQDTFYYQRLPNLLSIPSCSTLYFSVQAIGNSYKASTFSSNSSFVNALFVEAGEDTLIGTLDTIQIIATSNACVGATYSWIPTTGLSNPSISNPLAYPLQTTMYKVTVSNGTDSYTDSVKITVRDFTEQTGINLTGVRYSSVAWGDYDNDGDLDILLTGNTLGSSKFSKIYKNNGNNSFTEQTGINLTGVEKSSVAWGDYDNDGDLDILLTGYSYLGPVSKIYKNNGNNSFNEQTSISLVGVMYSSVAWGDYDNDGDLDILLTGHSTTGFVVSKIYKNNGNNSFTEQTGINLTGVKEGSVAWGDYDNDGDLDILLMGVSGLVSVSKIYKNNGSNSFSEQTGISLVGVQNGSVAWGDYDNDGDLDILLAGNTGTANVSKIYKNNGNKSFAEQTGISLISGNYSSAAWGDYDNDGDLDILLTGYSALGEITKIYTNIGNNSFSEYMGVNFAGVYKGSVAWGDYDNDGDLDILLTGEDSSSYYISKIYKNNATVANTSPISPTNLSFNSSNNSITWSASTDNETASNSLTYNVAMGSTNSNENKMPSHSFSNTGLRKLPAMGNQQLDTILFVKDLTFDVPIYCRVQAIDNGFKASAFSAPLQIAFPLYGELANDTSILCGTAMQLDIYNINGNANSLTYVWFPSTGLSNPNIRNPIANPSATTMYKVTATSPLGSIYTDSIVVNVNTANWNPNFTVNQTIFTAPPFEVQFSNNTANPNDFNFTWDFGDGTIIDSNNLNVLYTYAYNGLYSVSLIATHKTNSCPDTIVMVDYINCTGGPIGINNQVGNGINVNIFPNPNKGDFTLSMNGSTSELYKIQILSVIGEIIYSKTLKSSGSTIHEEIHLNDISSGLYILTVLSENEKVVQRFIIAN